MASILTDLGEEYIVKHNLDGDSVDVGLYDDSSDSIGDSDDIGNINTEPSNGNYVRQSNVSISASDFSGNWGVDNVNKVTFDVTNTTGDVDSYFFVANFQANDTGDGSAQDHLILTGSLSQSYALSNVDTLEISANTAGVTVD
jgi:hypothetical protein